MVYNVTYMSQRVKVGGEKFDDLYRLTAVNGNIPHANLDMLRTSYVATLLEHAGDTATDLPLVIAEKLVTIALKKQVDQAKSVGLKVRLPIGVSSSQEVKRVRKIALEMVSGGIEVASFTQLGQKDMFHSRVGNAVARSIRDEANMHEAPLGRKIFRIPETPYGDDSVSDYAIVTTKASIAQLEDAERRIDVISRQTGYIDMSEIADEETTKSLKIMGRVYDLGLHQGHNTLIDDARAKVAELFLDSEESPIRPALGSVYLKISPAGESQTESAQLNA